MSVARIVENVNEKNLKLCNAEEIQKIYGKLQNGDILRVRNDSTIFSDAMCDSVYIWPNNTKLVDFLLQDFGTVEIYVRDTILHKNAIVFFRPLSLLLQKKGVMLKLHLDKSDEGVAEYLGKGELSKKWHVTVQFCGDDISWYFQHEGYGFTQFEMEFSGFEKKIDFLREVEEVLYDAEMHYLVLSKVDEDEKEIDDTVSLFDKVGKIPRISWHNGKKLVDIDGVLYKRHPEKIQKFAIVRMRAREKDRFEGYLKTKAPQAKLLVKTEPEIIWTEKRQPVRDNELLLTATESCFDRRVILRKKKSAHDYVGYLFGAGAYRHSICNFFYRRATSLL